MSKGNYLANPVGEVVNNGPMSDEMQNNSSEAERREPNGRISRTPDNSEDVARDVILAGQGRRPDGKLAPGCPPINPGGRPKTKMMRDALLKYFKENPSALAKIIETAAEKAQAGDYQYFKEIRDMIDGKPAIAVTGEDGGPLTVNIEDARSKLIGDLV